MNKDKKRIANLMAAMQLTKDKEMKDIWSKKLEDLIKLQKRRMNERFNLKVSWSISNTLVWTVLAMGIGLMIVNVVTMVNMYSVIETMWLEMVQIKETNSSLYQFIEAHRNDFD